MLKKSFRRLDNASRMLHLQLLRYFLIIVAASTSVISIDTNVRTIILFVYSCETFFGQNQNIFFRFQLHSFFGRHQHFKSTPNTFKCTLLSPTRLMTKLSRTSQKKQSVLFIKILYMQNSPATPPDFKAALNQPSFNHPYAINAALS